VCTGEGGLEEAGGGGGHGCHGSVLDLEEASGSCDD
jgi:hypothetical protein